MEDTRSTYKRKVEGGDIEETMTRKKCNKAIMMG